MIYFIVIIESSVFAIVSLWNPIEAPSRPDTTDLIVSIPDDDITNGKAIVKNTLLS
jgi:hypothetical protein